VPSVETVIPILNGISTGDFSEALERLLDKNTGSLSQLNFEV